MEDSRGAFHVACDEFQNRYDFEGRGHDAPLGEGAGIQHFSFLFADVHPDFFLFLGFFEAA